MLSLAKVVFEIIIPSECVVPVARIFIFRHASVSSTYPGQSGITVVHPSHFLASPRTFTTFSDLTFETFGQSDEAK